MKKSCRGEYLSAVRKALSLFIALAMLCAFVPCFAATEQYGDYLYYDVTADNTVQIIGCDSAATSVDIPSEIEGLPVTEISNGAFYGCSGLTNVTIPNSVTTIGDEAFSGCIGLTSITIPESVTTIGASAFYSCSGLKNMAIPNSVTTIGKYAFASCSGLESVTIPESVTTIGNSAFCDCSSLTSVTIPESVTTIGGGAFLNTAYYNDSNNWNNGVLYMDNCLIKAKTDELPAEYEIKSGTRIIAEHAFNRCSGLESVTIPKSVITIGYGAFLECSSLTSITIPDSVTTIGDWAFNACSGLTNVTIPDSVTTIGAKVFLECSGLTSVIIGKGVTTIGEEAFCDCRSLTSIDVDSNNPNYCSVDGNLLNKNKTELIQYATGKTDATYAIPESVTTISDNAFEFCKSLKSVTIPDGVTTIGDYAFYACSSLESVTIPDSVTKIDYDAFGYCRSLTSVTIGNGVTTISDGAFNDTAYYNDSNNWENGVLYIDNCLIKAKSDELPAEYRIKSGTRLIGGNAFYKCSSLESVTIPESVMTIGYRAFKYCDGLTYVYYVGNDDEWEAITIAYGNEKLTGAAIDYNSTGPVAKSTAAPTAEPTTEPTIASTAAPTAAPTTEPTTEPTTASTAAPTTEPTAEPTTAPTTEPATTPTTEPTTAPTTEPTAEPITTPTVEPTTEPTVEPKFDLSYNNGSVAITSPDGAQILEGSVLIAAQYSGGTLAKVKTYAADENVDISGDFDPSAAVKLMLWSSMAEMKPLAEAVEAAANEASPFDEMDSSGSGPKSMVVSDVKAVQDQDGNVVYEISGYSDGAEVIVTTNQNTVAGNLTENIWSVSNNGKNYDADITWKATGSEGSIENAVGAGDIILYTTDSKLIARYANPQNVYTIAHGGEGTLPNTIGSRPNKSPSRCRYYFNKVVSAELNNMAVVKIEECDHDIVFDPSMLIDVVTISSGGVTVQKEAETITEIQNGDYLWVSLIDKGQTIGDMYIYRIVD